MVFISKKNRHVGADTLFFAVIFIDQLTKAGAGLLRWVEWNSGVSGGLAHTWPNFVVTTVVVVMVVAVAAIGRRGWQRQPLVAALFFGGAISNVIDRLLFGAVRDWLILPGLGWHNNLADYAINVAVALMIYNAVKPHTLRHDK